MDVNVLKVNFKIIEQFGIDYLCHKKICAKSKFCGLFILLLDTALKVPMVSCNIYTISPYIENVQTLSIIKVQHLLHKT